MPLTRELTVAGVTLVKHSGDDGYHYYRGALHGLPVTLKPRLGRDGKPRGWNAYARIGPGPSCIATGETLTLAVRRADYNLGQRAERRKT